MQTEDEVPTSFAVEDDESDTRRKDHPEQAAKKNKTSSEGPSGGDRLAGAAGDAAAAAKGRASLAAIGAAQSPRGADDAVSSVEQSPPLSHSAAVPLTDRMDRETKVPYSRRGKQIMSAEEADAIAAEGRFPSSSPLTSGQRRAAGDETTAMEVDVSLAGFRGGGEDAGPREAATTTCKSTAMEALSPPGEEGLERRGWGPNPLSAVGWEVAVAVAEAAAAGVNIGALEASSGNCHGDGRNGGEMLDTNGALMNGHVSADGRNVWLCDPRSRTLGSPWETNGGVDTAKASTEADVSAFKRNAQHATKRSWEDFCGKAKGGNAAAGAVMGGAAAGAFESGDVGSSGVKVGAGNGSSVKATARVPSASPPSSSSSKNSNRESSVTAVASATSFRSALSSCSSAAVSGSKEGVSGSSSASAGGASRGNVDAGSDRKLSSGGGNDSDAITTAKQGLLERAAALAGSVPEVAEALAALEKAEAVVGIDLPPKDKGPPDPEAVCMLCPVPRGAFLRAEKGNGGVAWCHCLCALSKELLIEDRVVKVSKLAWMVFVSC